MPDTVPLCALCVSVVIWIPVQALLNGGRDFYDA
ncbi:MAG: hypothetical protein KatS3mg056_2452 [Chloroflexus sp.]|nr:MAG: hypothetical protein KatS3mg056_2452 [Chloroflexus sp.]